VDCSGEKETDMLGFNRSEYSTTELIYPVNIIDQDHRRRNETVASNQSNNFQETKCYSRHASIGFTVVSKHVYAASASSHHPMGVDSKFLHPILLNAL
jgi:hypothetical protein